MAKVNDIKNATRKLDSELLTRLIKETTAVTDRTGQRVAYYIPLDEKFTDVCQYTWMKNSQMYVNIRLLNMAFR